MRPFRVGVCSGELATPGKALFPAISSICSYLKDTDYKVSSEYFVAM